MLCLPDTANAALVRQLSVRQLGGGTLYVAGGRLPPAPPTPLRPPAPSATWQPSRANRGQGAAHDAAHAAGRW